MRPFEPLTEEERKALGKVAEILRGEAVVPCTGCGYCAPHCPMDIAIPEYFGMYNELIRWPQDDWKLKPVYDRMALAKGRASDCISCGSCAAACPQRIDIPEWMTKIAETFDTDN